MNRQTKQKIDNKPIFYLKIQIFLIFLIFGLFWCKNSNILEVPKEDSYYKKIIQTSKNWEQKMLALEKLKNRNTKNSLEAIYYALRDDSERVRMSALHALEGKNEKKSVRRIIPFLQSGNPLLRVAALKSLCSFHNRKHIRYYSRASRDRDWMVRKVSLQCFYKLPGEKKSKYGFRKALYLSVDPVSAVQKKALELLVWYHDKRSLPFLLRLTADRKKDNVQIINVIKALAKLKHPAVKRRLRYLAKYAWSAQIKWQASEALKDWENDW